MAAPLILVTRGSPLALQQTRDAAARLEAALGVTTEVRILTTTGDRQAAWSLEKQGGKGLFTAELEQALLRGEADLAVHSSKDLPTEMPAGLEIAACLPRQDARDVLVRRADVPTPRRIATGSPRRRAQGRLTFLRRRVDRAARQRGYPAEETRPRRRRRLLPRGLRPGSARDRRLG